LLNRLKSTSQKTINQLFIKKIGCLLLLWTITACSSLSFTRVKKDMVRQFQSAKFHSQHTGFVVLNLDTNDFPISENDTKYFIPASTAKLFTFYTALQLLKDSLPSLKYVSKGNTAVILGTGDPTWHHPHFKNNRPFTFLKQFDSIFLGLDNYEGGRLGPGWAWEDYPYSFSPEITAIPLYGNVATVYPGDPASIYPKHFQKRLEIKDHMRLREWKQNLFYVPQNNKDTLQIPYITSKELTQELLFKVLGKPVAVTNELPKKGWQVLFGISRDTVLKQMLWKSDNFLAEHLMLMASSTLSDTLDFNKAKNFIWENHLGTIPQEPRWVDGSGLSRYNLFTPASMVHLLQKLYHETDSTRLFSLMPQWNSNGTLDIEEKSIKDPYIFAKSGSMGNIYNLCGYLKTKSGKLLAFSFMNNHFRRPSREIRENIYDILTAIHHSY